MCPVCFERFWQWSIGIWTLVSIESIERQFRFDFEKCESIQNGESNLSVYKSVKTVLVNVGVEPLKCALGYTLREFKAREISASYSPIHRYVLSVPDVKYLQYSTRWVHHFYFSIFWIISSLKSGIFFRVLKVSVWSRILAQLRRCLMMIIKYSKNYM